jgi:hypothetical protein
VHFSLYPEYCNLVTMCCLITINVLHSAVSFATLPHKVLWVDFGAIAITMAGSYHYDDIVAEEEVTFALSYLHSKSSSNTTRGSTNPLSNQQMASRCLLSKRYGE